MSDTIDVEAVEETRNLPAVLASEAIVARGELTVDEVVAQKDKILQIMQRVMTSGIHYGRIPGIDKPSLFKPGAEAINVALRLAPDYDSDKVFDGPHLTVSSKCILSHIPTGLVIASGEGLCSTRESKYAYRNQKKQCPVCGAEAIIKGKEEYGGGWVCWKKEGGCGAKFTDGDEKIEKQPEGKIPNPDLADQWNTVVKMANKRALVAAVLNGTAASDVFTQDLEDMPAASSPAVDDKDVPFDDKTGGVQGRADEDRKAHGEPGTDAASETREEALERRRRELTEQLSELATKLGKRVVTDSAIGKDWLKNQDKPAAHLVWLEKQIEVAAAKVAEQEEQLPI